MSLVAYEASSDEDSENEEATLPQKTPVVPKSAREQMSLTNGDISDEDEVYVPDNGINSSLNSHYVGLLSLPKPKTAVTITADDAEELNESIVPLLAKLPMPKVTNKAKEIIEEEDDEFLHKKPILLPNVSEQKPLPPTINQTRAPVKISIPSMKDFRDVDNELAQSNKNKTILPSSKQPKPCGLLSMLPTAKSEQNFAKTQVSSSVSSTNPVGRSISLIPDTVRNRRPAHNTEGVDGVKNTLSTKNSKILGKVQPKTSLVECNDSEASDDEAGDFFSLKNEQELPEVNSNEIHVMVAKRAAKMAETTTKFLEANTFNSTNSDKQSEPDEEEVLQAQKRYHETQLNEEALQVLVGSSSKRRRNHASNIEIVDISSSQVLPDREEWMRTALASSTTYQPTGVMVDEEPATGTRRKHQITYLAHKAKANEAELQAMWSVNRQNRRATQSKYGF